MKKKNESLRKQWLHNICRKGELPKDSGFYICSADFEESCFQRNLESNSYITDVTGILYSTALLVVLLFFLLL